MAKRRETLWRFVKVIYFLITIPAIALLIFLVKDNYVISRSIAEDDRYQVMNYWSFFAIIILIIISYILLTDGLRKLIGYISSGKFEDWINYKKLFSKFRYVIIAGVLVWCGLFSFGRYYEHQIRNYCREEGAILSKEGDCNSKVDFSSSTEKKREKDFILLNTELNKHVPWNNLVVLDFDYFPNSQSRGMGIAVDIDDYDEIPKEDPRGDSYKYNCHIDSSWLATVSWTGFLFSFSENDKNLTIDNVIQIPSEKYQDIRYPFITTRFKNYQNYGWQYPGSKWQFLEKARIIKWYDFDWDWKKNEFFLISTEWRICQVWKYIFVWYDEKQHSPNILKFYIYDSEKDLWPTLDKWSENNFNDGFYTEQTICNSWVITNTRTKWYYKYNHERGGFEYLYDESGSCH